MALSLAVSFQYRDSTRPKRSVHLGTLNVTMCGVVVCKPKYEIRDIEFDFYLRIKLFSLILQQFFITPSGLILSPLITCTYTFIKQNLNSIILSVMTRDNYNKTGGTTLR